MRHGLVRVAPCQCLTPGAVQTTSPGLMRRTGSPCACAQPSPAVTIKSWPSGWVCQLERAPCWKVTVAPPSRASPLPLNGEVTVTDPVKFAAGPSRGFAPGVVTLRPSAVMRSALASKALNTLSANGDRAQSPWASRRRRPGGSARHRSAPASGRSRRPSGYGRSVRLHRHWRPEPRWSPGCGRAG
jgi:hypothetical protein